MHETPETGFASSLEQGTVHNSVRLDVDDVYVERIRRLYFSAPDRRMPLAAGGILFEQDMPNARLYLVLRGTLVGTITTETMTGDVEQLELFDVGPGAFAGMYSFFAPSGLATTRVTAATDVELAWMDKTTLPVDEKEFGDLRKQFFPIIMHEIANRQLRLSMAAREREAYLKRLHMAESLATLGQLSAGLAHELNNAIGVVMSSAAHLQDIMRQLISEHEPGLASYFERGVETMEQLSSAELRQQAHQVLEHHSISYEAAKSLVRMMGGAPPAELPEPLDKVLIFWEAGRNCRDLQFAADHAADIIHSVKQLSGGHRLPSRGINVNSTLHETLGLMKDSLRDVEVQLGFGLGIPDVWGTRSELVQIWVNIVKNGLEVMRDARTLNPTLSITSIGHAREVEVRIANNGPPIPETLRTRLFQPNITTKKGDGSTMGLGLGLYIVKRLVDTYNGQIEIVCTPSETCFAIRLPFEHLPVLINEL